MRFVRELLTAKKIFYYCGLQVQILAYCFLALSLFRLGFTEVERMLVLRAAGFSERQILADGATKRQSEIVLELNLVGDFCFFFGR